LADEKTSSPLPRLVAAASVALLSGIYFFHSQAEKKTTSAPPEERGAIANPAEISAPNGAANALPINHANDPGMPPMDRARADSIRQKLRELSPILPGQASANSLDAAPLENDRDNYPEMPHGDQANVALKNYIRDRVHDDYFPLAKSCYENALAKTPDLSGRLVMKLKIVGDKRVGGVVDSVETDPETTMHDDAFLTCLKESMMAVSFDAPPNGGAVTVDYPIEFSPDDGGESD
jgi:hypothetical protein